MVASEAARLRHRGAMKHVRLGILGSHGFWVVHCPLLSPCYATTTKQAHFLHELTNTVNPSEGTDGRTPNLIPWGDSSKDSLPDSGGQFFEQEKKTGLVSFLQPGARHLGVGRRPRQPQGIGAKAGAA